MLSVLAFSALAVWVYMSLWFIVSIIYKRNDVADIAWGPGFIVVSLASLWYTQNINFNTLLLGALVTIWGLRLGLHIGSRNIKKSEDSRYKVKRELWGKDVYWRSYIQIFILQGVLIILVATPIIIFNANSGNDLTWLISAGAYIWAIGFSIETLADRQLRGFVRNPKNKGRIMQSGLWRYSRHPNYFGELTQWWGIGILVLSCSYGYIGLVGPIIISYLIIKVSGVPLLEQKYANNPEYQTYKQMTSVLIPRPTRK